MADVAEREDESDGDIEEVTRRSLVENYAVEGEPSKVVAAI